MMGSVAYLTQICEEVSVWAYRLAGSQGHAESRLGHLQAHLL